MDILLEKKRLGKEIKEFLDEYACIRPDFDPEFDEDYEKYTSPDASELLFCSELLIKGEDIHRYPWSDYSSGGYKRGKEVFDLHESLKKRIVCFIK